MNECPLMQKLNEKLEQNTRIFHLSSIQLSKNKYVRVLFNISSGDYDRIFDYALQESVTEIVKELIPDDFEVEIDFRKVHTTENAVGMEVTDFIYKNYPSIFSALKDKPPIVSYDSGKIIVTLPLAGHLYVFLSESGAKEKLEAYLETRFIEKSEVIFEKIEEDAVFSLPEISNIKSFSLPTVDIKVTKPLFGGIPKAPLYISEVLKRKEQDLASVCGKISNFRTFHTKADNRPFYIFQIDDTTENITAKIFLGKKRQDRNTGLPGSSGDDSGNDTEKSVKSKRQTAAEELSDGLDVAAEGKIVYDERDSKYSMLVNRLALCDIDYLSIDTKPKYKELPGDYSAVRPVPFNEIAQEAVDTLDYSAFQGGKFAVIDVNYGENTIISLSMLKFYDGKAQEILEADFVRQIDYYTPPYSFSQVIADFYLFAADMDIYYQDHDALNMFLSEAKQNLYNFTNNFINVTLLAKKAFPDMKYSMEKLCKRFGIEECLGERTPVILGKLVRRLILH